MNKVVTLTNGSYIVIIQSEPTIELNRAYVTRNNSYIGSFVSTGEFLLKEPLLEENVLKEIRDNALKNNKKELSEEKIKKLQEKIIKEMKERGDFDQIEMPPEEDIEMLKKYLKMGIQTLSCMCISE